MDRMCYRRERGIPRLNSGQRVGLWRVRKRRIGGIRERRERERLCGSALTRCALSGELLTTHAYWSGFRTRRERLGNRGWWWSTVRTHRTIRRVR